MKRRRLDPNQSRSLILDATGRLMQREGYGAVTARRVAAEASMKAPLIHYYYPSMDDLLLAFYQRSAEQTYEMLQAAIASDRPLRALWDLNCDPERTALAAEFIALANHRPAIRDEIARNVELFRALQTDAVQAALPNYDDRLPEADIATVLIAAISRALVMERVIGISAGHDRTRAYVEAMIAKIEETAASSRDRNNLQTAPICPAEAKPSGPRLAAYSQVQ